MDTRCHLQAPPPGLHRLPGSDHAPVSPYNRAVLRPLNATVSNHGNALTTPPLETIQLPDRQLWSDDNSVPETGSATRTAQTRAMTLPATLAIMGSMPQSKEFTYSALLCWSKRIPPEATPGFVRVIPSGSRWPKTRHSVSSFRGLRTGRA
jgi:hypothetical protein